MPEPLVSIGVIVAGPLSQVERAVRSALAQDYGNLEVRLCDAVQSQESAALTNKLAGEDPRISIHRSARALSVVEATAALRDTADGEYFLWLDALSWLAPEYVRLGVAYLGHNPGHILACGTVFEPRAASRDAAVAPSAVAFENAGRRVESLIGNLSGLGAWYGLYRLQAIRDVPLHPGLGFELGCLLSVAWRGKIGAVPDMRLHREGIFEGPAREDEVNRLGVPNYQASDPWLAVAALVFCNIAYFDDAFLPLPVVERIRLAVAAADAVALRWTVQDEGAMISYAARLFPAGEVLTRFRASRSAIADAALGLHAVSSTDPVVQNLIGTINVLCRMKIGSIPKNKSDEDVVRQLEVMWDEDKSADARNKVAIVSAMYL
ncbi:MAG: glycosyltransferase [Alphaproteobacteria bacterium]|nr:glycosyltransferase [Alphaproteobacteria bacterium]